MYRYRILYKKTGFLRFISHLDLLRTIYRGVRRAGISLVFSEGYNPHPKISFAAPLPVGVEGYDEYLDMELKTKPESTQILVKDLNNFLPEGLEVVKAQEVSKGTLPLMAIVEFADYEAKSSEIPNLTSKKLDEMIEEVKAREVININKRTKKGYKEKNIKTGIIELDAELTGKDFIIYMTLKTGSRENVRPGELLKVLTDDYLPLDAEDFKIARTAIYGQDMKRISEV